MKSKNQYLAEVVESSLMTWVGQCWQWQQFPSFGSLVAIDTLDKTLFAVVFDVKMGSGEPNRYPMTYQKTEQELLSEYPHIFEFIKTNFHCLPIGYRQKEQFFHLLPPEPAKIHAFMRYMTEEEKGAFFTKTDFMPILFNTTLVSDIDELLLAIIRNLVIEGILVEEAMYTFLDFFSLLAGNDYRRLKIFIQRINQCMQ